MAYPPALPPATRTDATPSADVHAGDHNALSAALAAVVVELGANPSGGYADVTARLGAVSSELELSLLAIEQETAAALAAIAGTDLGPITTRLTSLERGQAGTKLPKWRLKLANTPGTARLAMVGDSTFLRLNAPSQWTRLTDHHMRPGGRLEGMLTANLLGDGNNGNTGAGWLSNKAGGGFYTYNQLVADAPDVVVYGFGVNDVRLGATSEQQLTDLLVSTIDSLAVDLPNTEVILRMPSSFLTTDVNSSGFVKQGGINNPAGVAQAYSTLMRNAYRGAAALRPAVLLIDTQRHVYGETSPALSSMMSDQIHPSAGHVPVSDLLVDLIGHPLSHRQESGGVLAGDATARYRRPFTKPQAERAHLTAALDPIAAAALYPAAMDDPDRYELLFIGELTGSTATAIFFKHGDPSLDDPRAALGIHTYKQDLGNSRERFVQIGSTVYAVTSSASFGFWNDATTEGSVVLTNLTSGLIPAGVHANGTVVRAFVRKARNVAERAILARHAGKGYGRYQWSGVIGAGGTWGMDLSPALADNPLGGTNNGRERAVKVGDTILVEGAAPFVIPVGASFGEVANNLRLTTIGSFDWSTLTGRRFVLYGDHPPELVGDRLVLPWGNGATDYGAARLTADSVSVRIGDTPNVAQTRPLAYHRAQPSPVFTAASTTAVALKYRATALPAGGTVVLEVTANARRADTGQRHVARWVVTLTREGAATPVLALKAVEQLVGTGFTDGTLAPTFTANADAMTVDVSVVNSSVGYTCEWTLRPGA